jgi:hypothetical protein
MLAGVELWWLSMLIPSLPRTENKKIMLTLDGGVSDFRHV